jgi:hypothetical protein
VSAGNGRHRARVLQLLEEIVDVPLCTAGPVNVGSPLQFAGVIRRAMGDLDGAIDRLRQAAASLESVGARGYLAQTRAQLAAALAERARPRDLDEARRTRPRRSPTRKRSVSVMSKTSAAMSFNSVMS